MGNSAFVEQRDDLLQGIERDEQQLRVAMHDLTAAAGSKLNVGAHIEKFPLTWAIGAFLLGVWLGRRRATAQLPVQRR